MIELINKFCNFFRLIGLIKSEKIKLNQLNPNPNPLFRTLFFAADESNKIFSHIDIVYIYFYYLDIMGHLYYLWLSRLQLSPQGASVGGVCDPR